MSVLRDENGQQRRGDREAFHKYSLIRTGGRALSALETGRFLVGMVLCYAVAIMGCLAVRPLWIDEVLQLVATRSSPSISAMFDMMGIAGGAVPLGYLTQRPFVLLAGPSAFWARFPSALFSIASCILLIRICRALNLSRATTAVTAAIFMIAPSQVRYAMEARPYSEAMFFGLLAAMALGKLAKDGKITSAVLAELAILAGLYTQAYIVFPIAGVAVWYAVAAFRRGDTRRAWLPIACLGVAAILFVPWYVRFSQEWQLHNQLAGVPDFQWTGSLALDIFKGIPGGSFLCSAALLFLAAASLRAERIAGSLLLVSLGAIAGPLLADTLENYFFASRQLLYALPGLAILGALGFDALFRQNRFAALTAMTVFSITALISDVGSQLHAREDWRAAAETLSGITREGYCVQPALELSGAVEMYSVFAPSLASTRCPSAQTESRLAFVSNFAMDPRQVQAAMNKLQSLGFVPRKAIQVGGTTITVEQRPERPQAVR